MTTDNDTPLADGSSGAETRLGELKDELERKRQEKMDMEDAARYIQRKWKWYQEVGKHLAKKKKGKKGGKKKK